MKLTAKVKLLPTEQQRIALTKTMELANAACNDISDVAWQTRMFNRNNLHHLVYYDIKEKYNLSAQVVVRCLGKVVDAYKLDRKTRRTFRPMGAIAYDDRILKWYADKQLVSIWADGTRRKVEFAAGPRQLEMLQTQKGESDLCYIDGEFYLFATCDIDEPTPDDVSEFLGVDLGIVNVASDSDGNVYSGAVVQSVRKRRRRQRKRLQAKGTKAARRRLKAIRRKESRFASNINHTISKQIVDLAKRTGRGIALEDLKGIRNRVRLRKQQRGDLHSWSFHQLGEYIKYKARLAGVPVVFVDPRYTSQACSKCGCIDKRNRPNQNTFLCVSCGYAANADTNAAMNISARGWGLVSGPHFSDATMTPLAFGA